MPTPLVLQQACCLLRPQRNTCLPMDTWDTHLAHPITTKVSDDKSPHTSDQGEGFMPRRWPLYSLVLGVSLFCALSLSGCDFLAEIFRFDQDADAQSNAGLLDRPVQTVVIRAGSFSIDAANIDFNESVEVRDEVTVYRQITGRVFFTLSNETNPRQLDLIPEDVIIERPGTNLLTIIQNSR
jgi:hypothetical protein